MQWPNNRNEVIGAIANCPFAFQIIVKLIGAYGLNCSRLMLIDSFHYCLFAMACTKVLTLEWLSEYINRLGLQVIIAQLKITSGLSIG